MRRTVHSPSGHVLPKSPYHAHHISHTKRFPLGPEKKKEKLNRLKADLIDPECAYQWLPGRQADLRTEHSNPSSVGQKPRKSDRRVERLHHEIEYFDSD